jgi:DNA helicase-2/ATP-dependent DNA helicase PcrA
MLPLPRDLCEIYSFARNCKISLSKSLKRFDAELLEHKDAIADVCKEYERKKKERQYLDYDDVLDVVATVLESDREVRDFVGTRYDHILVDEMQDTNPLQWQLLDAVREKVNLYCVGDDAQSIYGFRGADFRNVHSFRDRVPGGTVLKLRQNYRSTQEILDLANWLLRQSPLGYEKELVAERGVGIKPKLIEADDEYDEGQWLANDISRRRADGAEWKDHMILIRSRFSGRAIELALLAQKIPFEFIGGTSLLQSAHVRDVLSLLRVVANYRDEIAWVRYLALWPGVGDRTASDLAEKILGKGNIEECVQLLREDARVPVDLAIAVRNVAALTPSPARAFNAATGELWQLLASSYRNQQWEARQRDFPLVEQLAMTHGSILSFIEEYILNPLHSSELRRATHDDMVTLITIHSAKGTERKVCYVPGVSPGAYPITRCLESPDEVEEERRVLYVAITRARDELILSRARRSTFARERMAVPAEAAKQVEIYFLNGLPPGLVEQVLSDRTKTAAVISSTPRQRPTVGIDLT